LLPVGPTLFGEAKSLVCTPVYGAMSAGVRSRRELERPELDVNDRIRRSIEARRGLPKSWRSG
jgi:hypothetical protein